MEKSPELHQEDNQSHDMNRRDLLKVLAAAGGGMAAAAFLPGKWLKPVVEAGVLPAHAQATETLTIAKLDVNLSQVPPRQSNSCFSYHYFGSVDYLDDLCKVTVDPTQLVGSCPTLTNWSVDYDPNPCDGTFEFEFNACCNEVLSVYLQVGSRQSNTLAANLLCGFD